LQLCVHLKLSAADFLALLTCNFNAIACLTNRAFAVLLTFFDAHVFVCKTFKKISHSCKTKVSLLVVTSDLRLVVP